MAAVWLLMGAPGAPKGEWSQPSQSSGDEMDALRDAAKTDPASLDRLKRLAEAGDPFAEFDYATLFDPDFKYTNTPNIETAMEWYLKAAKQGFGTAQANYGARLYDDAYGVPVDYNKAFPWLLQGAQQGDVYAQRRVGESYKYGRGTKEDPKLAVQWFRTAADRGDAYSQAEMGDAYADGNGVDQNMTEAIGWYRKAADQKEAWAQRQLGIIYLYGKNGVPRDPATAFQYLKASADAGNMGAQYYLGYMYDQGIFVQKDVRAALDLYRKSADQGFADAQNVMGLAYWKGIGVPKDLAVARDWFQKAVDNGSKEASSNLAALGGAPRQAAPAPAPQAAPAPRAGRRVRRWGKSLFERTEPQHRARDLPGLPRQQFRIGEDDARRRLQQARLGLLAARGLHRRPVVVAEIPRHHADRVAALHRGTSGSRPQGSEESHRRIRCGDRPRSQICSRLPKTGRSLSRARRCKPGQRGFQSGAGDRSQLQAGAGRHQPARPVDVRSALELARAA